MLRSLSAALACLACVAAAAQDAPRRKSGQWEVSVAMPQMDAPMQGMQFQK